MRNKIIIYFFCCWAFFINHETKSKEDFIFKSKSIEILNSGENILGKNGVVITTSDNTMEITAENSNYNRNKRTLELNNNIKIFDLPNNLEIKADFGTYFKIKEKIKLENNIHINKLDNKIVITSDKLNYFRNDQLLELLDKVKIQDETNKIELKSEHVSYYSNENKLISRKDTKIFFGNEYYIHGENIIFFKDLNQIYSEKKTIVYDYNNNILKLDGFKYDISTKELKTKKLEFFDSEKNIYNSNNAIIDLNTNNVAAKDIEVYLNEGELGKNARIKGKSLIFDKEKTIIKKGIFTNCEVRGTEKCPPWSIKSDLIVHDKKSKTINYTNSILEFFDFPIFYFPKFFHPDPTVKRQSGFLTPSLKDSSSLGASFTLPYYKVISDNKDYTVTPRFFSNNNLLIQNEYRQVEKDTNHVTDFSLKSLDKGTKSHFFSNTKHFLDLNFNSSEIEFNIEKTSNDTYLKKNDIKTYLNSDQNLLNSYIKFNVNDENFDFYAELGAYEDLTIEKDSDKFQYILPNFTLSKNINTDLDLKGILNYKLSGSIVEKDTNINEKFLSNDIFYNSDTYFSKFGTTTEFNLEYKNTIKEGSNSNNYPEKKKMSNYVLFSVESSLPLIKKHLNFTSNLDPKIVAKFNPDKSEKYQDLDRPINMTNIFSNNRIGVTDSFEGGNSLTYGFNYDLNRDLNTKRVLGFGLAQVLRDVEDKKLPKNSTMQTKSSNIVGNLFYQPDQAFKINYDFSIDNSFNTMNFSKIDTEFSVNNFVTKFEFLEENNEIGNNSYLSSNLKYLFKEKNSLAYTTRRNRKTNLTEFYNLVYEYKNDCLVAAIEYNKDYYKDRDIKPNESIFFKLTFTPLTSLNSPNLK